jgi:LuxR family maltose regulon positive regulatory protein
LTERAGRVQGADPQSADQPLRSNPDVGMGRQQSSRVHETRGARAGRHVLVTKIRTPQVRPRLIHRERLLAKLEAERARPLMLLCAPAGFGKTTLLVDWLASRKTTVGPPVAIAWLSLDEGDNDPAQFLRLLIAALRTTDPRIGATLLEVLNAPPHPPSRAMLALLVNDLVATGRDTTLVFEDFHVIHNRAVHDAVAFLLANPPPLLHVVIITREDPPLPLPRLRVADAVCEVRAADLRFTLEEAALFLEEVMKRRLAPQDLSALVTRTEGWVGGLQLAALSMPTQAQEVSAFVAGLVGSHRYLLEYLTDEVLIRQSPPVVAFLLRTSILDRLNVELCAAVLREENLDDTRAKLDEVGRRNLFLVALDDERLWYRYHGLFADLLRARLRQTDPALFAELHNRASRWYEQHALPSEAIQHALTALDFDRAAQLVESNSLRSIAQGEMHTVLDWYRRLPVPLVQSDPRLSIPHAYALMLSNQSDLADVELQHAEQHLPPDSALPDVRAARGRIALLRGIQAIGNGDLHRTVALAAEARELLPPEDAVARAIAQLGTAYEFRVSGDVTTPSERALLAATGEAGRLNLPALERVGLSLLARLYMRQGKLRRADVTFERAERTIGRHVLMGAPIFHLGRGV